MSPTLPVESADHHTRPPSSTKSRSVSTFHSPVRHHRRHASAVRQVKETLNARSEYSNSSDDGQWQHRINQYIIKQEIGRGSFGAVHIAVDQHGTEYAVKEFSKSRLRKRAQSNSLRLPPGARRRPGHLAAGGGSLHSLFHRSSSGSKSDSAEVVDPLNLIREEIAIMKKLNHPNLAALYEVLDDPAEDSLYMVMEMCKKGVVMRVGVDHRAQPYDDERCRHLFRDLILGIEYLHAQGVVHRDIKPDNCLLTHDDVLKVVDFGVSEMFEKEAPMFTAKSVGSPAFLPPELCVARHGDISGTAADIWSMGVTLYCLRFGRIPFEKSGVLDLYESIRHDDVTFDVDVDPDLCDLLTRILEKDPAKRITMAEMRAHPWVTRRDTDPLLSAEENTANLVEPPTEEEMKTAITGNFRQLLTVMRAVKKFKRLALRKRGIESPAEVFGQSPRLVQTPLSMSPPSPADLMGRTISMDNYVVSGTLEAAHEDGGATRSSSNTSASSSSKASHDAQRFRLPEAISSTTKSPTIVTTANVALRSGEGSNADEGDNSGAVSAAAPAPRATGEAYSSNTTTTAAAAAAATPDWSKATVELHVGPGEPDEGAAYLISESPTGTDTPIYETAYREEVERIRRARGRAATIFLTRRVESGAADKLAAAGAGSVPGTADERPRIRWGEVLERAKTMTRPMTDAQ